MNNYNEDDESYLALRNAIINQAYLDYWAADNPLSNLDKNKVIEFFMSDWYKCLTTINADFLLRKGEIVMNYKKEPLLHGYVTYPENIIVAKNTKTSLSDYSGIVTEKKGTINQYLVFSDKNFSDFTSDEECKLFEALGKIYPEIQEILLQEVDAEYKDGIWINKKEWDASPRMVLFPIRELKDEDTLYYGTGIRRKEA